MPNPSRTSSTISRSAGFKRSSSASRSERRSPTRISRCTMSRWRSLRRAPWLTGRKNIFKISKRSSRKKLNKWFNTKCRCRKSTNETKKNNKSNKWKKWNVNIKFKKNTDLNNNKETKKRNNWKNASNNTNSTSKNHAGNRNRENTKKNSTIKPNKKRPENRPSWGTKKTSRKPLRPSWPVSKSFNVCRKKMRENDWKWKLKTLKELNSSNNNSTHLT